MADGIIGLTSASLSTSAGKLIDHTLFGASDTGGLYRQRVVLSGENSSGALVVASSSAPNGTEIGLYVRQVGPTSGSVSLLASSGLVVGQVAPSSNWSVGLLGSSGVVVGMVAPSSAWTLGGSTSSIGALSSGSAFIGSVGLTTDSVVGLTTTATVGLTTSSLVGLSSALSNYVTNSTTVPVYLGVSSGNVVGQVAPSSVWLVDLTSGTLTLGTLTTGTVVGLTTTATVGLTTSSLVGLSSAASNYVTNSTTVPVYLGASSGIVVGLVAPSSQWTVTGGAGSTLVSLSSGTAQIGILGPSSASVIGSVAPSSNWSVALLGSSAAVVGSVAPSSAWSVSLLASSGAVVGSVAPSSAWSVALLGSSATVVGSVAPSSVWSVTPTSGTITLGTLTTGTIVGLTTTAIVGLTTTSLVGLSSAVSNYVTNSTSVPIYLGGSSGTVIGQVAPSSAWVVDLSTSEIIALSSALTNYVTNNKSTEVVGIVAGIATYGAFSASVSTGNTAGLAVDSLGRQIIAPYGSRTLSLTKNLVMVSNTSMQVLIAGSTGGPWNDIIGLWIGSSVGTTALLRTKIMLFSSSGQTEPGVWSSIIGLNPATNTSPYQFTFPMPLPASVTSTGGWFIVSTSSAAILNVTAQYVPTST